MPWISTGWSKKMLNLITAQVSTRKAEDTQVQQKGVNLLSLAEITKNAIRQQFMSNPEPILANKLTVP